MKDDPKGDGGAAPEPDEVTGVTQANLAGGS